MVTPFSGFLFGGSFQDGTTGAERGVDQSAGFGLILGLRDTPRTQYELLYSFQRTNLPGDETSGGGRRLDLDIHYLHLGSTYEFPKESVRPFISAGVGLASFVPAGAGQDSSTNFSLSLGGGVKIPLTDRVGLRLEGRGWLTLFPNSTEIFCASSSGATCAGGVQGGSIGQFELLSGIYFEL